jgi:hypothetical protein
VPPQSTCGSERDKFAKSSALGAFALKPTCDRYGEGQSRTASVVSGSRRIPRAGPVVHQEGLGLLAYLALHSGQSSAPETCGSAWGHHGEVQARDSLRRALSLLRKALSHIDPRALIAHEDTISFEPTALTTDAIVFNGSGCATGS